MLDVTSQTIDLKSTWWLLDVFQLVGTNLVLIWKTWDQLEKDGSAYFKKVQYICQDRVGSGLPSKIWLTGWLKEVTMSVFFFTKADACSPQTAVHAVMAFHINLIITPCNNQQQQKRALIYIIVIKFDKNVK